MSLKGVRLKIGQSAESLRNKLTTSPTIVLNMYVRPGLKISKRDVLVVQPKNQSHEQFLY